MSNQIFTTFQIPKQPQSYISLTNLTINPGLLAPDIWTPTSPSSTPYKLQPASISLHLQLRSSATEGWSAASTDRLDGSTVHYGLLSKALRGSLGGGDVTIEEVFGIVKAVVEREGKGAVEEWVLEVRLVKAGMWSDEGIVVRHDGGSGRRGMVVQGMRVMCLVGVNANERRARQPLVVSVWVYEGEAMGMGEVKGVMGVEQVLAGIIEETEFETLESLAEFAVEEVQVRLLRRVMKRGWVQLRLEKPRAVAFADCPAIEVLRHVEGRGKRTRKVDLAVVKPYTG